MDPVKDLQQNRRVKVAHTEVPDAFPERELLGRKLIQGVGRTAMYERQLLQVGQVRKNGKTGKEFVRVAPVQYQPL